MGDTQLTMVLMAIRKFTVGPLRGLVHAEASDLGNLVVFAGPNGAGKSTLLDLLRTQGQQLAESGTQMLFAGAYRTWRSSRLNRVGVYGNPLKSFTDALALERFPPWQVTMPQEWQSMQNKTRSAGESDDAQVFVKSGLVQLGDRQKALVHAKWETQRGQMAQGDVPSLFAPFERLVRTLLPHLEWVGIDATDPQDIRCLFQPAGTTDSSTFDIDDLSAGEKAAIALMLPFVERQADQLVTPPGTDPGVVPITLLMDEPEIHLHPLLQLQVLEYLRELAAEGTAQFILTTHSPTLLDALSDDELYLVSPAAISPDNQVSRLTTSHERLEVAREITGSTHLLTRGKPIVFLEGETERAGVSSDVRLVAQLLPVTKSWALVPGRAKRDVVTSVQRLRQNGLDLPGTPVFGVVDADRDDATGDEHVAAWPVAMIENLLLDPQAIYDALTPYGNQTGASTPAAVLAALQRVTDSRLEDEIRLRVQRQLPIGRLEVRPDFLDDAEDVAAEQAKKWLERLRELDIPALTQAARVEVEAIVAAGKQLDRFHGKRILHAVYTALRVNDAGLAKPTFALAIAAQPAAGARARCLAGPAIERILLFFPSGLPEAIRSAGDQSVGEPLAVSCEKHHAAWAAGVPQAAERAQIREAVFGFARTTPDGQRRTLVALAGQIGTP
jgi:ABC-type cobalamin/Fe3+-siderophores transport system ATPase subunit